MCNSCIFASAWATVANSCAQFYDYAQLIITVALSTPSLDGVLLDTIINDLCNCLWYNCCLTVAIYMVHGLMPGLPLSSFCMLRQALMIIWSSVLDDSLLSYGLCFTDALTWPVCHSSMCWCMLLLTPAPAVACSDHLDHLQVSVPLVACVFQLSI